MREYKDKINAQKQDYYKDRFYHAPQTIKEDIKGSEFEYILDNFQNEIPVSNSFIELGIAAFFIAKNDNLKALRKAKDLGFSLFTELICSDNLAKDNSYEIQYLLLNMQKKQRIRIITTCKANETIESGVCVFKALNWSEREAYDMLGINFINHPNLKRLLMPDDWFDHPLKKSYPLQGDEFAQWYEIDRIFGKEYRDVVGPENRDPGRVDCDDTNNFSRIYHEVPKGAEPISIAYKQEYQEDEGVMFVKKIKRSDSKFIEGRR